MPHESRAESVLRGKELVTRFECARCHEGTGAAKEPRERRCVGCHTDIVDGHMEGRLNEVASWKVKVRDLAVAPSLSSIGRTVSEAFVARYLVQPFDLRPRLRQTMPRLSITPREAADIAAYLANESAPLSVDDSPLGNAARGRDLFEAKRCASCHAFGGSTIASKAAPDASERAMELAPDLRFTRDRWARGAVVAWLRDPKSVRPDAAMPRVPLSEEEARDLATFVMTTALDPPPPPPAFVRLPVLTRPVSYDEVEARVLHKTCWHCHEEPDYARGDGGPGMTGGFGFAPRHLNLASYEGLLAGYVDDAGERKSIFSGAPGEMSPLLSAILAREDEERGISTPRHGMPLGMPALTSEEVQLVESWIVQGHDR